MSILAYNLYRLLALQLERYEHLSVHSLYDKFVLNGADVIIQEGDHSTTKIEKKSPPDIGGNENVFPTEIPLA